VRLLLDEMLSPVIARDCARVVTMSRPWPGIPSGKPSPILTCWRSHELSDAPSLPTTSATFGRHTWRPYCPAAPGRYGVIFMPGTCRRTKNDIGRIVATLEAKLGQYPGDEDLVNAGEWL
jgi:hypothetical protein